MADFNLVKDQLTNYFKGVAAITDAHKPPGKNVSDGDFGVLIASDAKIRACFAPLTIGDTRLRLLFKDSFQDCYYAQSSLAFKTRLKVEISAIQSAALAAEKFIVMPRADLLPLIKDITAIATLDFAEFFKLYDDASKYWDAVQKEDFRVGGQFANGWIAIDLKNAADAANLKLPAITTSPADPTDKLISVMSEFYTKVSSWSHGSTTQEDGNAPWLKADWETQFYAACIAAAGAIAKI